MSQTPNVTVPLVYLDRDRAGRVTREWLPYITKAANAASAGDLTALQLAVDAITADLATAEGQITTLTNALAGLIFRVEELEALEAQTGTMVLQPAMHSESISMVAQPAIQADSTMMVWQR